MHTVLCCSLVLCETLHAKASEETNQRERCWLYECNGTPRLPARQNMRARGDVTGQELALLLEVTCGRWERARANDPFWVTSLSSALPTALRKDLHLYHRRLEASYPSG